VGIGSGGATIEAVGYVKRFFQIAINDGVAVNSCRLNAGFCFGCNRVTDFVWCWHAEPKKKNGACEYLAAPLKARR